MSHGGAEVDWAALLDGLRRGRRRWHPTMTTALDWAGVPAGGIVADVGCGAGGVAVELAHRVGDRGRVFAVDGEDALLAETAVHAGQEGVGERVETLRADLDDVMSAALMGLPPLDLLWASAVVHHLADQQAAVARLVSLLAPGGRLLLAEGGLPTICCPWDLGIGAPGLEERLHHACTRSGYSSASRRSVPDGCAGAARSGCRPGRAWLARGTVPASAQHRLGRSLGRGCAAHPPGHHRRRRGSAPPAGRLRGRAYDRRRARPRTPPVGRASGRVDTWLGEQSEAA